MILFGYHYTTWIIITVLSEIVLLVNPLKIPSKESVVIAPGDRVIFSCPFLVMESLNLTNLIINWQHKDMVVHSFYYGRDQLERQGQAYRGRTRLFMEQILKGNASLALEDVQPIHHGEYTCSVTNEKGGIKHTVQLIVAALYDDPRMAVLYTCNNIYVTLSSSQGFPESTVTWKSPLGTNVTTSQLDTRGRYEVQSTLSLSLNTTQTVTVEMSLEILSQHFIKEITLNPQPECIVTGAADRRGRHVLFLTLILLIITLLLLLIKTRH